jgi:exodeoxyribonuclease VII small subunit
MSDPAPQTFDALMGELESIVARLEGDSLSLEDALEAYQRGVGLAVEGHGRLQAAERRIEEIGRGGRLSSLDAGTLLGEDGEP